VFLPRTQWIGENTRFHGHPTKPGGYNNVYVIFEIRRIEYNPTAYFLPLVVILTVISLEGMTET
jgi:hypothetical protein